MISYNKLWKTLIDRKMNKTQLMREAGLSTNAIAKLGKSESVQLAVIDRICKALSCDISDVVEVIIDCENEK